jgi:hypothetical protein
VGGELLWTGKLYSHLAYRKVDFLFPLAQKNKKRKSTFLHPRWGSPANNPLNAQKNIPVRQNIIDTAFSFEDRSGEGATVLFECVNFKPRASKIFIFFNTAPSKVVKSEERGDAGQYPR